MDRYDWRAWDVISSRALSRLAERLAAYDGAVRAAFLRWRREHEERTSTWVAGAQGAGEVQVVSAEEALAAAGWG